MRVTTGMHHFRLKISIRSSINLISLFDENIKMMNFIGMIFSKYGESQLNLDNKLQLAPKQMFTKTNFSGSNYFLFNSFTRAGADADPRVALTTTNSVRLHACIRCPDKNYTISWTKHTNNALS